MGIPILRAPPGRLKEGEETSRPYNIDYPSARLQAKKHNFGCSWLVLAASNCACSWLHLAAPGCSWLFLAAPRCSWLLLAAHSSSWLLLASPGVLDCSWLALAVSGYHHTLSPTSVQTIQGTSAAATASPLPPPSTRRSPTTHSHLNVPGGTPQTTFPPQSAPLQPPSQLPPPSTPLPLTTTGLTKSTINTATATNYRGHQTDVHHIFSPHGLASSKLYGNRHAGARAAISV